MPPIPVFSMAASGAPTELYADRPVQALNMPTINMISPITTVIYPRVSKKRPGQLKALKNFTIAFLLAKLANFSERAYFFMLDASPHRPFLFLRHYLGLQFLRREGFLLRSYVQPHAAKFGLQFIIALGCCQCRLGALARLLIVIVVIALVKQHKRDVVLGIKEPIPQPRPKAVIAIDRLYLLVVGRLGEQTAYLLSSAFFFVASSAACASAALHLFSVSLTPSPIGFIESAS